MQIRLMAVAALTMQLTVACATGGKGDSEPSRPAPAKSTPAAASAKPAAPGQPNQPNPQAHPGTAQTPGQPAAANNAGNGGGNNGGTAGLLDSVESKWKKAAADPKNKAAIQGCKSEAEKYCKAVEKDPKALANCLKQNESKLAPICKAEVEAFIKTHK